MAAASGNEVDDVIRELRKISGFGAYVILNNDGKLFYIKQKTFAINRLFNLSLNIYNIMQEL